MARYSVGSGATALAARTVGTAYAGIRAITNPLTIYEIGIFNGTAVVSNVGIIRSATVGTASTTVTPDPENTGTPNWRFDTAWSSAPTVSTNVYKRMISIPAAVGNGYTFVFPSGLVVAAAASLLIWNFSGTSATTFIHVVADE
jgi:hypothetical protein